MFDMELYQQVLGLTAPWKVTDVRLDVESTEIHVHVEHADGCRWNCPHCSRELACYDHAPKRQWRHLNTCQFHTLVHARVPRVECPEHGVVQVTVPWAEPHGRFTLLMERFVIVFDRFHVMQHMTEAVNPPEKSPTDSTMKTPFQKQSSRLGVILASAGILLAPMALPVPASAQVEFFWKSDAATNSTNTNTNWVNDVTPGTTSSSTTSTNTDIMVFDNTAQAGNLAGSTRNLGGVQFRGAAVGSYALLGATTSRLNFTLGGTSSLDADVVTAQNLVRIGFTGSTGNYFITNNATSTDGTLQVGTSAINYSTGAMNMVLGGANTGYNQVRNVQENAGAGALTIVKNGTGSWVIHDGGTYTGGTILNEGQLGLRSSGGLGTGTFTINGGAFGSLVITRTFDNNVVINADFQHGVSIPTVSSAASVFNGTVDLTGSTRTITLSQSLVLNGVVSNGGITLTGTNTLGLGGANTYTGATNVNDGTLLINGNQSTATGAVSVASSAILRGTGTIGGATAISGILAPGDGGIGTLSVANDVTWNGGENWLFELGAAGVSIGSPGTSDLLSITGSNQFLKGTGSSWTFDFGGTGAVGWYKLADWTGGSTTFGAGDFAATGLSGANTGEFFIENSALYIQVVPEPATWALAALGLACGSWGLRRRRWIRRAA